MLVALLSDKIFQYAQYLLNAHVKVNKTQIIFAKIDSELHSMSEFWRNFFHKVKDKKTLEFTVKLSKIEEKDKVMENSYAMIQMKEVLNVQRY